MTLDDEERFLPTQGNLIRGRVILCNSSVSFTGLSQTNYESAGYSWNFMQNGLSTKAINNSLSNIFTGMRANAETFIVHWSYLPLYVAFTKHMHDVFTLDP